MEQDIYPSAKELYSVLCRLRKDVLSRGDSLYRQWKPLIQRRHFTYSAWNLAFYLALRCHDLRKIQRSLLPFGLSSLGRGEARAITNLDAVMASLGESVRNRSKISFLIRSSGGFSMETASWPIIRGGFLERPRRGRESW